jgi:hypothetical protein
VLRSTGMNTPSREETLYVMVRWANVKTALEFAISGIVDSSISFNAAEAEAVTVRPHASASTPPGLEQN